MATAINSTLRASSNPTDWSPPVTPTTLLRSGWGSNFTVRFEDGQEYRLHREILMSRSKFFRSQFGVTPHQTEVVFDANHLVTEAVFKDLVDFWYVGNQTDVSLSSLQRPSVEAKHEAIMAYLSCDSPYEYYVHSWLPNNISIHYNCVTQSVLYGSESTDEQGDDDMEGKTITLADDPDIVTFLNRLVSSQGPYKDLVRTFEYKIDTDLAIDDSNLNDCYQITVTINGDKTFSLVGWFGSEADLTYSIREILTNLLLDTMDTQE